MHSYFFQFIFEGEKLKPNTTAAIAQVLVTTWTCVEGKSAVIPAFADPGIFLEDMHKFYAIKMNTFHEQGGILYLTNQRICLASKPIRTRRFVLLPA